MYTMPTYWSITIILALVLAVCLSMGSYLYIVRRTETEMKKASTMPTNQTAAVATFSAVAQSNNYTSSMDQLPVSFPPECTQQQLNAIQQILSPKNCDSKSGGRMRCSISTKTKCHDGGPWLTGFFTDMYKQQQPSSSFKGHGSSDQDTSKKIAVYVGCNKGLDAVDTWRMLSRNRTVQKQLYREKFYSLAGKVINGPCMGKQQVGEVRIPESAPPQDAVVHCIEAMPITAKFLTQTVQELNWQDSLIVTHSAVAREDGTMLFPNNNNQIGKESSSLANCLGKNTKRTQNKNVQCEEVPVYSLDHFVEKVVDRNEKESVGTNMIDILSIDVEGYDFEVLLGGAKTLGRARYLEFEYHQVGAWKQQKLEDAIEYLKEHNFVCYWGGNNGELWRITGCWMPYFEFHQWSNVVCVNIKDPITSPLARSMEDHFLKIIDGVQQQ